MDKIRILIADDHAIVRMGLVTLLGIHPDLEVVGEAANGQQAVARAQKLRPDVIIMDLVMPKTDGAEATRRILEDRSDRDHVPRVLILTSFGTAEEIKRALDAGAAGVLLKSTANSRLVSAIRKVAAGKTAIADDVEQLLSEEEPPVPELSPRQREILESLTRGLSNGEIAVQLGISAESVKTHVTKIFEKLGAANRAEAIAIALRRHLLKI